MQHFDLAAAVTPSSWCVVNNRKRLPILDIILYKLRSRFQRIFEFGDAPEYTCCSYDEDILETVDDYITRQRPKGLSTSIILESEKLSKCPIDLMRTNRHYKVSFFLKLGHWENWATAIDYLVWFPKYRDYTSVGLRIDPKCSKKKYLEWVADNKQTCFIIDNLRRDPHLFVLKLDEQVPAHFVLHAECPNTVCCEEWESFQDVVTSSLYSHLITDVCTLVFAYVHPKVHACCGIRAC
jgi:hypothetical protein